MKPGGYSVKIKGGKIRRAFWTNFDWVDVSRRCEDCGHKYTIKVVTHWFRNCQYNRGGLERW